MATTETELTWRLHDASEALKEINAGTAKGYKPFLWGRAVVENFFELLAKVYTLSPIVSLILLGFVIVIPACLCIGFINSHLETEVADLWIEAGGRLDAEIDYTDAHLDEDFVTSSEVIIQVTRGTTNFTASLYDHLKLAKAVVEMTVERFDYNFTYRDLCAAGRFATGVAGDLDRVAAALTPCQLFTALDCFWEGSFLQEPDEVVPPVNLPGCDTDNITWANLDIPNLAQCLSDNVFVSNYTIFINQSVSQLGLIGYIDKPCFTSDPACPTIVADPVQNALVNGCMGYTTLLFEPVDLIVGGSDFEAGVADAIPEALRTVFVLSGPGQISADLLFYKRLNFSINQIEQVLDIWKDQFFRLVIDFNDRVDNRFLTGVSQFGNVSRTFTDNVYGFTSDTVDDLGERFSDASVNLVIIGYILMILYCSFAFFKFSLVKSRSSVGLVGIILVALASAGALGLTAACGVSFNITTTQIYPFLVLGLGVDDMFVIADAFFEIRHHYKGKDADVKTLMVGTLRTVGPSITLTSITNAAGFFLAAVIPIPAIRNFAIQVGVAVVFNYLALLIGLPSFLVLDYLRVENKLVDIFCCFPASICPTKRWSADMETQEEKEFKKNEKDDTKKWKVSMLFEQYNSVLTAFVVSIYSPLLQNYWIKSVVITLFTIWFAFCIWGCTLVEDGLNVDDIVPDGTPEHGFASANIRYFAAYSVNVITKDINYTDPDVQKALLRMSQDVREADRIVTAGGITEYWLQLMINYFGGLQTYYCSLDNMDRLLTNPLYLDLTTLLSGILIALERIDQATAGARVVGCQFDFLMRDADNIPYIPPDKFYQYVVLWRNLDTTLHSLSSPSFDPRPPTGSITQFAVTGVPQYGPILYAEHFLFVEDLRDTGDFREFIDDFRDILGNYSSLGIESYPSGSPFLFWEQYINLRANVGLACGLIIVACFIATSFFLMDMWSSFMLVCMLAVISAEVFGVTGFLDIKFSSLPAIMIIASVGVSVEFTAPLMFYFLKAAPNPEDKKMDLMFTKLTRPKYFVWWFESRNERMHKALEHRFTPIFNGTITTFLGIIMLVFAPLPFIRLYFFSILFSIVVLGAVNGLILLPVLLSVFGPPSQVYPVQPKGSDTELQVKNESYEDMASSTDNVY